MNTLNDNELLRLIKKGDETAFTTLFHRYWTRMHLGAHSILKDEADACDIVQEVFIWFWQNKESIVINTTLKGYLLQAVRNKCINKLDKLATGEKRRKQYAYLKETMVTAVPMENSELRLTLHAAMGELGVASRTAFEMIYIDHKSQKETALELGISAHTVKTHVRNVLRKLRKKLRNINEI
ncbi:RNA polymerase sigma factor [Chitinophaga filiformis]|uniref:RNA polymerase sigma-70 factor n=1 Tax=Chitinophaga filiformis TaxID=104663 RepID=A0ABY4HZZ5_CHIFI|nr:RNA polymerase sigma-70 factor [Chitinophaga filiformis]UPK68066.1 RNA polymerase sigma-70 factor [Chitinophaga filiformis]